MPDDSGALLGELARFGADVVLVNADVVTMDPARPRAEGVAVKSGRIVAVGSDAEVRQTATAATRVLNLGGGTLLPGFVDTHSHVSAWSHTILQVDGAPAANRTIGDILEKVGKRAATQPPGTWIEGYGYDHLSLEEKRHLTRWDLDAVAPEHPVHFWHISGHFTAVNSKALEIAGITADTPDPDGGVIYRDENGEPNGLLGETGIQVPVLHLIPPKPVEERARGLRLVDEEYVRAGVTSVHDANLGVFGGLDELETHRHARQHGDLRVRVYALLWFDMLEDLLASGVPLDEIGVRTGSGDEWFRMGGVKIWADGSAPGRTAALDEPYLGEPVTRGELNHTQERLDELVARYHDAGFQMAIHANGERGIEAVISAFEAAQAANPRPDARHRIEHLLLPTDDHLDRMAAAGIVTTFYSAQIHVRGDTYHDDILGPERSRRLFPARSAADRGIVFGSHCDSPVMPPLPLTAISAAVTRETSRGGVLGADERLTVDEALRSWTLHGAYLAFEEHIKGSIAVGKVADFVALSGDPYGVEPSTIKDLSVEMTMIGGDIVYEA